MNPLAVTLCIAIVAIIPLGIRNSIKYRKACITKKAKRLGYDLTFEK